MEVCVKRLLLARQLPLLLNQKVKHWRDELSKLGKCFRPRHSTLLSSCVFVFAKKVTNYGKEL